MKKQSVPAATSTPAKKAPSLKKQTYRFTEEDMRYIEALSKDTGIANDTDVLRLCLRDTAKSRKLTI